jgi:GT2 family glycosyltransferase
MLCLERAVVEDVAFAEYEQAVVVSVRPRKGARRRCGVCGRRRPWHDLRVARGPSTEKEETIMCVCRPKLSAIILTWNSEEVLRSCFHSLYKSLQVAGIARHEIIVIDNGSQDGTADIVIQDFPEVNLLRNTINRGVAPARNQGLQIAHGDFLLLLDVDTVVTEDAVGILIRYLEEHPTVGLVAPKLVYPDGQLQYSCRKFPTVWTKMLRRIPLKIAAKLLADELYKDWDHNSVREVDYVIGACQLIRRKAFEEVGYLDNDMFYGPEDVDYCLRLQKLGWKVVYNPQPIVIHKEQRITKRLVFSRITWKHITALIRYFHKHRYYFSKEKLYLQLGRKP